MLRLKEDLGDIINATCLADGELAVITTYIHDRKQKGNIVMKHNNELISVGRSSEWTWNNLNGIENIFVKRLKTSDISNLYYKNEGADK